MKKSLVLVLIVLMAASAFGQISLGGWGRGVLAIGSLPDADNDASLGMIETKSWGGGGARVGYNITGSSDLVGFQIAIDYNNVAMDAGANANAAYIWVKPMDMLKLTMGTYSNHKLRGNAEFGSWNWLRFNPGNTADQYGLGPNNRWGNDAAGEDTTFARNALRAGGFLVEVTPMEALYIFASPLSGPDAGSIMTDSVNGGGSLQILGGVNLTEALLAGQYGFGYDIAGIGQLKAQFIGVDAEVDDDDVDGWINAAFKLTAVQGLMAEVGVFVPTADDANGPNVAGSGNTDDVVQIAAYAKYTGMEGMTVHASATTWLFDDLMWQAALGLDYRINDELMLNSDVRIYNEERNMETDADGEKQLGWGVSANVSKGLGSGKVGLGLEVTNVGFAQNALNGDENGAVIFAIPVLLEYWF